MRGAALVITGLVLLAGCGGGNDEPVQPLAESCKQQVAARDYVPEAKKTAYYAQCQGAVADGADAVRQKTRDVCVDAEQRYLKTNAADKRQAIENCESWLKH